MDDVVLCMEFFKSDIIKLSVIVGDDHSGQTKAADDGFSQEVSSLPFHYLYQWFDLHPLNEVVDGHDNEPSLSIGKRKRTKYIDSPLIKWPWCQNGCELT